MRPFRCIFLVLIIVMLAFGCAHKPIAGPDESHGLFTPPHDETLFESRYAPVFLVYDAGKPYNRIGGPMADYTTNGGVKLSVDPDSPVIFTDRRTFETPGGTYTNLIYRIHFQKVPFNLVPFHLTAGRNTGIIIIITLDADGQPVLVTNAGTCGCYAVVVPTSHLPMEKLPEKWEHDGSISVYGETLPAMLDYEDIKTPRLLIHLRPGLHRVMDMAVVDQGELDRLTQFQRIPTSLAPVQDLENIPLNGKQTSFYHDAGILKGHVKGSIKPWESLLMSLISLDLFVGSDKFYGDTEKSGNPFYTSLKPWNRKKSDMNDFAGFLNFRGWRF